MPVFQLLAALTPTPLPKGLEQLAQRETNNLNAEHLSLLGYGCA